MSGAHKDRAAAKANICKLGKKCESGEPNPSVTHGFVNYCGLLKGEEACGGGGASETERLIIHLPSLGESKETWARVRERARGAEGQGARAEAGGSKKEHRAMGRNYAR